MRFSSAGTANFVSDKPHVSLPPRSPRRSVEDRPPRAVGFRVRRRVLRRTLLSTGIRLMCLWSHDSLARFGSSHYGRLAWPTTGYEVQSNDFVAARRLACCFRALVHVPRAVGPASSALGAHATVIGARTVATHLRRRCTVEIPA